MKETENEKEESHSDWLTIVKSLSVEPAGFLVIMSAVVSYLIYQNLMMETICRVDLEYPEEECKEIINKVNSTYKTQEREIQKVAAMVSAKTSFIFSLITILVVLFIGPWSDANGRKIPLLISVSGLVAFSSTMLICYLNLGQLTAIQLSLVAMLPMSITGGGVVFAMSAYSYISDTTNSKDRTVRTGLLSAFIRSGTPFGFAIGGALTKLGFSTVTSLLTSMSIGVMALLIVLLTVKNPVKEPKEEGPKKKIKSIWARYNPFLKLVQAFAILFKKRKDYKTFLLLIVTFVCYAAPGSGEYSMLYLFVRERLQWNISDYGFFSMYNWLMSAAGVILSMFILSRKLRISDPVVGFVAGISQIGGSTTYAFAKSAAIMYLASAMDMMNGTIGVIVRSMLSKTVESNEVGKLFALLGVIESLLPLVIVPSYAMLYKNTATFFPGAIFILSAVLTIPAEVIFLIFICKKKNGKNDEKLAGDIPIEEVERTPEVVNQKEPEMVRLVSRDIYGSKNAVTTSMAGEEFEKDKLNHI